MSREMSDVEGAALAAAAGKAKSKGREIGLQGWDTANVLTMDTLNAAIKKQKKSPPTFDYTYQNTAIKMSGTWGDFEVVCDKNRIGGTVVFRCPVKSGTGVDMAGNTEDLAGVEMTIEVTLADVHDESLAFTDKTGTVVPKKTETRVLLIDKTSTSTAPAVVVDDFTPASLQLPFQVLFQNWFNDNIDTIFDPIFHIALINVNADKGDYQWLKPTALSYATIVDDAGDGIFAALCMTDGDPDNAFAHQVDAGLTTGFPAGTNSVLAISGEKFCEHFLKTGAQQVMKGSKLTDFDIVGDGLVVTNNTELVWQDVTLPDGLVVSPKVPAKQFTMRVVEDTIELQFTGLTFKHPLMVGNDVFSVTFTQYMHIMTGKNSNGQIVLVPTNKDPSDPNAKELPDIRSFSCNVTQDSAAQDFERGMELVSIALSVLPIGLGLFKAGAWVAKVGPAALKLAGELSGIISKSPAIFEVVADADQISELAEEALSGTDNLAAAAAFSSKLPADSGLITLLNRFALGMGFLSTLCLVLNHVMTVDHQGDMDLDNIPALDDFMANVLGAAKWPGATNWELKDAKLAQSLLFYGECTI